MKDQRLTVFRAAVDALVESLEALVRVSRWTDADAPPDALSSAASKLVDRLGSANRLWSGTFSGTPADARKVTAMCTAMKRLDAAYVVYRKKVSSGPENVVDAAAALEFEIAESVGTRPWN
jgi:hypothetical protein